MSTRIPYANLGGARGENWPVVQGCSGVDESGVELQCKPICWMRDVNHRFARSVEPTFHLEHLADPFHWREPRRILVAFTGDTFDRAITDEQIRSMFGVMRDCPRHTFLVLTKQAKRMEEWTTTNLPGNPPLGNVMLGVSVMGPDDLWRVDALLRCPAAVRFISAEPLVAGIDLRSRLGLPRTSEAMLKALGSPKGWTAGDISVSPPLMPTIDWVVTAGDSSGRMPHSLDWFRKIRDDCAAVGTKFMLKDQTGYPELDGRQHMEMPQ